MKPYLLDVAERAAKTFVQTFLAAWMTSGATNVDAVEQLLFGAVGAALSVVTSALSRPVGDKSSASLLPVSVEVGQE